MLRPARVGPTIRGELAIGRISSRHKLVFGRSVRILTMMQSCASAAKLRGGGPILVVGVCAMSVCGSPPPRIIIGSPSESQRGRRVGKEILVLPAAPLA